MQKYDNKKIWSNNIIYLNSRLEVNESNFSL